MLGLTTGKDPTFMRINSRRAATIVCASLIGLACASVSSAGAQAVPSCAPSGAPAIGGKCLSDATGLLPGGAPQCAPGGVPILANKCLSDLPGSAGGGSIPTCAPAAVPGIGGQCLPDVTGGGGGGIPPQLAGILGALGGQPGLPPEVTNGLQQLKDAVASGSPPSPKQAGDALAMIAATPGLPPQLSDGLYALAAQLGSGKSAKGGSTGGGSTGGGSTGGGSGAGGSGGSSGSIPGFTGGSPFTASFKPFGPLATGRRDARGASAYRAVVRSLRLFRKRRAVNVVVQCTATASKCNTALALYARRRMVAGPVARLIPARGRVTYRLRLSKAGVRAVRRGTTLRAAAVTSSPYGLAHSAKSLRVKRRHR